MSRLNYGVILLIAVAIASQVGCAVPQKPGRGIQKRLIEPGTQTAYWLYLPEDYVARDGQHPHNERWPMVVTLHGLKPYDNALWQCQEWQEEADRYGLIIVAPNLRTCDSLRMQLPLRDPTLPYVRQDEEAIFAIMSEVFQRTNADPHRVLMTSFSSGGYLAHYLVNRHPHRFSVLAVRGSNFNRRLMLASQVARYRDMPIGIFFGENDIAICRRENLDAIAWYRSHRFDVEARMVQGLGHERRPQFAAAMFARASNLTPKTPPDLGSVVMLDVPVGRRMDISTQGRTRTELPATAATGVQRSADFASPATTHRDRDTQARDEQRPEDTFQPSMAMPPRATYRATPPEQSPTPGAATPRRPHMQPYSTPPARNPVDEGPSRVAPPVLRGNLRTESPPGNDTWIRVVHRDGTEAPMWMTVQLDLPSEIRDGAHIQWKKNADPLQEAGRRARILFDHGGSHIISAHIVTADDRTLTATRMLYIPAPTTRPADS